MSTGTTFGFLEILLEPLVEILGGLGLLGLAYVGGSIVYLLFRAARRALRHLTAPTSVAGPDGRSWSVRVAVAPPPLRYTLSRWFFKMRPSDIRARQARQAATDGVARDELAHPSGLIERFDEAAGVFVWALLALTVVALAVFVIEVALVVLVATVVFILRFLRGGWQCEVVDPDGRSWHVPADGGLAAARTLRDHLRNDIAHGRFLTAGDGEALGTA